MKLSIVATLYRSSGYIEEFYSRMVSCAEAITDDFELVLVNDGSPDDSLEKAIELHRQDPRVVVVDLSRNFGHHKAIRAGLKQAAGDYIFLIDTDLEEDPETLSVLWQTMQSEPDADSVHGTQISRKGAFFERLSGWIAYRLVNLLIHEFEYPTDTMTARLMKRRFVEAVLCFEETEYDLWCTFSLAGFKQVSVPMSKGHKGSSDYTLFRKVQLLVTTITSSTAMPLVIIFFLGMIIFGISIIGVIYLCLQVIFFEIPEGWTSILVSIWFIGGLLMLSAGTIGLYIARVFKESKRRPDSIVKEIYRGD